MGGPVPVTCGLPRIDAAAFALAASGRTGLCCEENDELGVASAYACSGDDSLDEVDDLSMNEAVDESRSLDGIFDCELANGE